MMKWRWLGGRAEPMRFLSNENPDPFVALFLLPPTCVGALYELADLHARVAECLSRPDRRR